MFESIFYKILVGYLGNYIGGIDREDLELGVWSGKIILEYLYFKQEAIDLLEWPVDLQISLINKIEIKVPWRHLQKMPVEINIENVFFIVTPKNPEKWNVKDFYSVEKKKSFIEDIIKKYFDTMKQAYEKNNNENNKQSQNFGDKLIQKIIDNIKLTIKNIHGRLENPKAMPSYTCGIIIKQINVNTQDEQWKYTLFFDRSKKARENQTIRKMFQILELGVYWNSHSECLIKHNTNHQKSDMEMDGLKDIIQYMLSIGKENQNNNQSDIDYVLYINISAKLTYNYNNRDWTVPAFIIEAEVNKNNMYLKLKKNQVKDILQIVDLINLYQYIIKLEVDKKSQKRSIQPFKHVFRAKNSDNTDIYSKQLYLAQYMKYLIRNHINLFTYQKQFTHIFLIMFSKTTSHECQKHFNLKTSTLTSDQYMTYWRILRRVEFETLEKWTKTALQIYFKFKKEIIQLGFQKFFNQVEMSFKLAFLKKHKNEIFTIQNVFQNFNLAYNFYRPDDYVFLEIQVKLQNVDINLTEVQKHQDCKKIEGCQMVWDQINFSLQKRVKNFEIDLDILDINLEIFTKYRNKKSNQCISIPILEKNEFQTHKQGQKQSLLHVKFNKNPLKHRDIFFQIQLDLQQIVFTYYPLQFNKIISYFIVPPNNLLGNKHQLINDQTEWTGFIQDTQKSHINIKIASPIIIIPFKCINDPSQECWVIELGDLSFKTDKQNEMNFLDQMIMQQQTQIYQTTGMNQTVLIKKESVSGYETGISFQQSKLKESSLKSKEDKNYDKFTVTMQNIQLQYYTSINFFRLYFQNRNNLQYWEDIQKNFKINKQENIEVIKHFSIHLNIHVLKQLSSHHSMIKNKVVTHIGEIFINVDNYLYKNILQFFDQFTSPDLEDEDEYLDNQIQELLQTDYYQIKQSARKIGILYKRNDYNDWDQYLAMVCGTYLYLYYGLSDTDYSDFLYLNNFIYEDISYQIGKDFTFRIQTYTKNEIKEYIFCCESKASFLQWDNMFQYYIQESNPYDNPIFMQADQRQSDNYQMMEEEQQDYVFDSSQITLRIDIIVIEINDKKKKKLQLELNHLQAIYQQNIYDYNCDIQIQSLSLKEFLQNNHILPLEFLISSTDFSQLDFVRKKQASNNTIRADSSRSIIECRFEIKEKKHPDYNKVDVFMKMNCGELYVNWKPEPIKYLMNFFFKRNEEQIIKNYVKSLRHSEYQQSLENKNKSSKKINIQQSQNVGLDYTSTSEYMQNSTWNKNLLSNKLQYSNNIKLNNDYSQIHSKFLIKDHSQQQQQSKLLSPSRIKEFQNIKKIRMSKANFNKVKEQKNQKKKLNRENIIGEENIQYHLEFDLYKVQVILVHKRKDEKQVALAKLEIYKGKVSCLIQEYLFQIYGSVNSLALIDMTNYPYTVGQYNLKQQGIKIIDGTDKFRSKLLDFHLIHHYQDLKSFKKNDNQNDYNNIANEFRLNIEEITIYYFQKVIKRIIDYSLDQIVGVFLGNYNFNIQEEDILQFPQNKIKNIIDNPEFNDIYIEMVNPRVILKPEPYSQISDGEIEVNLGLIQINNSQQLSKDRISPKSVNFNVWTETFFINLQDLKGSIRWSESQEEEQKILEDINLQVEYESLLMYEHYVTFLKYFHQNDAIELNNSEQMTGSISPAHMKLYRNQYKLFLEIFLKNILYEDKEDNNFIYNYELKQEQQTPFHFSMWFQQLSLTLIDKFKDLQNTDIPSVQFQLIDSIIDITQVLKDQINLEVFAKQIKGKYFDYQIQQPNQDAIIVHERGIIGDIQLHTNKYTKKEFKHKNPIFSLFDKQQQNSYHNSPKNNNKGIRSPNISTNSNNLKANQKPKLSGLNWIKNDNSIIDHSQFQNLNINSNKINENYSFSSDVQSGKSSSGSVISEKSSESSSSSSLQNNNNNLLTIQKKNSYSQPNRQKSKSFDQLNLQSNQKLQQQDKHHHHKKNRSQSISQSIEFEWEFLDKNEQKKISQFYCSTLLTDKKEIVDIQIENVDIMVNASLWLILKDFLEYDYQPYSQYKMQEDPKKLKSTVQQQHQQMQQQQPQSFQNQQSNNIFVSTFINEAQNNKIEEFQTSLIQSPSFDYNTNFQTQPQQFQSQFQHQYSIEDIVKEFILNIQIHNSLVFIQGSNKDQLLVCNGQYFINITQNLSQEFHEDYHISKKDLQGIDEKKLKYDESSVFKFQINNLECFSCQKKILQHSSSNPNNNMTNYQRILKMAKKNLLKHTNIVLKESSFNCGCYMGKNPTKHTKTDVNIEKTTCQLSYKDLILLFETVFYQIEQINASDKKQQQKEDNLEEEYDDDGFPQIKRLNSEKLISQETQNSNQFSFTQKRKSQSSYHGSIELSPEPNEDDSPYFSINQSPLTNMNSPLDNKKQSYIRHHRKSNLQKTQTNKSKKTLSSQNHLLVATQIESLMIPYQDPHARPFNSLKNNNNIDENSLGNMVDYSPSLERSSLKKHRTRVKTLNSIDKTQQIEDPNNLSINYQQQYDSSYQPQFNGRFMSRQPSYFQQHDQQQQKSQYYSNNQEYSKNTQPKMQSINMLKSHQRRKKIVRNKMQKQKQEEIFSFFCDFPGLEIILINDLDGQYVPIIDLQLSLNPPLEIRESSKLDLLAFINFELQFFNPYVGKFEPIIEKQVLQLNYVFSEQANPQQVFNFSQINNKPININISEELIAVFANMYTIISEELDKFIENALQEEDEINILGGNNMQQSIELTSPNRVRNVLDESTQALQILQKRSSQLQFKNLGLQRSNFISLAGINTNNNNNEFPNFITNQNGMVSSQQYSEKQQELILFKIVNMTGYDLKIISHNDTNNSTNNNKLGSIINNLQQQNELTSAPNIRISQFIVDEDQMGSSNMNNKRVKSEETEIYDGEQQDFKIKADNEKFSQNFEKSFSIHFAFSEENTQYIVKNVEVNTIKNTVYQWKNHNNFSYNASNINSARKMKRNSIFFKEFENNQIFSDRKNAEEYLSTRAHQENSPLRGKNQEISRIKLINANQIQQEFSFNNQSLSRPQSITQQIIQEQQQQQVKLSPGEKFLKEIQQKQFICNIQIKNFQKTLQILSSFLLYNSCDLSIALKVYEKFIDKDDNENYKQVDKLIIEKFSRKAIPLKYLHNSFIYVTMHFIELQNKQIKTYDYQSEESEKLNLKKLILDLKNHKHKIREIFHKPYYTILSIEKSKDFGQQQQDQQENMTQQVWELNFQPLIKVQNCLPYNIYLEYYYNSKGDRQELYSKKMMEPQQSVFLYRVSIYDLDIYYSIYTIEQELQQQQQSSQGNMSYSYENRILQKEIKQNQLKYLTMTNEQKEKEAIYLLYSFKEKKKFKSKLFFRNFQNFYQNKDFSEDCIYAKCYREIQNNKTQQIYLFSKVCLINTTNLPLVFLQKSAKNNDQYQLIQGQDQQFFQNNLYHNNQNQNYFTTSENYFEKEEQHKLNLMYQKIQISEGINSAQQKQQDSSKILLLNKKQKDLFICLNNNKNFQIQCSNSQISPPIQVNKVQYNEIELNAEIEQDTLDFQIQKEQIQSNQINIFNQQNDASQLDQGILLDTQEQSTNGVCEFVLNIKMVEAVKGKLIYSRIIEISPKYIIINKCQNIIELRQGGKVNGLYQQGILAKIKPNSRTPLYWKDQDYKFTVQMREQLPRQVVEWSGELRLDKLGTVSIFCIQKTKNIGKKLKVRHLRVQITKLNNNYIISILTVGDQHNYMIENKCQYFNLECYQNIETNTNPDKVEEEINQAIKERQVQSHIREQRKQSIINLKEIKISNQNNTTTNNFNTSTQIQQQDTLRTSKKFSTIGEDINMQNIYKFVIQNGEKIPFSWQYPNLSNKKIKLSLIPLTDNNNKNNSDNKNSDSGKNSLQNQKQNKSGSLDQYKYLLQQQQQQQQQNLGDSKQLKVDSIIQQQQDEEEIEEDNQDILLIKMNDIYENTGFWYDVTENQQVYIQVQTIFQDQTKILKFTELDIKPQNDSFLNFDSPSKKVSNQQKKALFVRQQSSLKRIKQTITSVVESEKIMKMVNLRLNGVGISFITKDSEQSRQEINYIYFENVVFQLVQNFKNCKLTLDISKVQIDNNSDKNTLTPVILTATHSQQLNNQQYLKFLEVKLSWDPSKSQIYMINSLQANIMPFTLKIDEEYLLVLNQAIQNIKNMISEDNQMRMGLMNKNFNTSNYLFAPLESRKRMKEELTQKLRKNNLQFQEFQDWNLFEIPEQEKFIFINDLKFPDLVFDLSFHRKILIDKKTKQDFFLKTLAEALGSAVNSIEEAPISLNGFELQNFFGTQDSISPQITQYYKKELFLSIFNIIGAFQIIGNPVGLVRRVGSGLGDMIQMPVQGIRDKSPLGFGKGIIYGTGSLVKNTLAGSFNSVNSLAGSVSSGVAKLSFDNSYQEQRRRFMIQKPAHIFDGMQQAAQSIYKGLEGGVIGVFEQPYQGAKNDGLRGFAQGSIKGITGIVSKPITGILDAAAKTAEGFTQTITVYEDKPNGCRIRLPRIFYDSQQYYKNYDLLDSNLWHFFALNNIKYRVIEVHILNREYVFVLTMNSLIIVHITKNYQNTTQLSIKHQIYNQNIVDCQRIKQTKNILNGNEVIQVQEQQNINNNSNFNTTINNNTESDSNYPQLSNSKNNKSSRQQSIFNPQQKKLKLLIEKQRLSIENNLRQKQIEDDDDDEAGNFESENEHSLESEEESKQYIQGKKQLKSYTRTLKIQSSVFDSNQKKQLSVISNFYNEQQQQQQFQQNQKKNILQIQYLSNNIFGDKEIKLMNIKFKNQAEVANIEDKISQIIQEYQLNNDNNSIIVNNHNNNISNVF